MDSGWPGMRKENAIRDKSFAFAVRVVRLFRYLQDDKREFVMSKQVIRSGTAIGALVREAEQGESRADFVHKLAIALKEANETEYWLELLYETRYLSKEAFGSMKGDLTELLKLLTSIIKTTRATT